MNCTNYMIASLVLCLGAAVAQPPVFDKVMITEVSWGEPDGVEITNFAGQVQDLSAWRLIWSDPFGSFGSGPISPLAS